jgi:enoyl-CoA hydratase
MTAPRDGGGTPIVHDDDRGRRWITFNRPAVLNALRVEDLDVVTDAVTSAGAEVTALVFTGAGDSAFSAGMHVDTFVDADPADGRAVITRVGDCVGAVRRSALLTVAMLNGYCLGAAFELALACDLRVAHPEVRFGLPEVRLGIPSVVEAALLPHYVGLSKAKEIALTGDLYSFDDLSAFGLVNRVVPRERLRDEVDDLLARVAGHSRDVLAAQKALFGRWLEVGLEQGIAESIDVFADVFARPATTAAIGRYREGLGR